MKRVTNLTFQTFVREWEDFGVLKWQSERKVKERGKGEESDLFKMRQVSKCKVVLI